LDEIKNYIQIANAKKLPYPDDSFDIVISINTVDHLPLEDCKNAISEINRVAKTNAFICANVWKTEE
jgi:ubiquinone/menaquinone biosynthesis C-methylase UbiE